MIETFDHENGKKKTEIFDYIQGVLDEEEVHGLNAMPVHRKKADLNQLANGFSRDSLISRFMRRKNPSKN